MVWSVELKSSTWFQEIFILMSVAFVLIDVDTGTKIDNVVKINMSCVICFHEGISLIGQVYIGLKIMTFRKYRNSSMERTMHYEFVMFFLKL